ncbi:hypothetical protein [Limnobacter alexandrii]|jgi:hypothetical protein|uniref:hypothetical protein n=1 Tax=Limnobacter alexandrii TaxID=2570352 RepID=UPI0011082976|nr:hypothetical protein [Limnobacter alexandrii]
MAIQSKGTDRIGLAHSPNTVTFELSRTGGPTWAAKSERYSPTEITAANQSGLYSQTNAFDYQISLKFSGLLKTSEASQHRLRTECIAAILHWVDESHLNSGSTDFSFEQLAQVRQILDAELVQSQLWLSKLRGTDEQ